MLPRTELEPRDDPAFLAMLDRVIAGLVQSETPDDVYLVHIDNWFGPKWLKYSGKGVVAFPDGYGVDILVALDEHYQEQLTFPPFTRNRVVAQYYFCRLADGTYEEQSPQVRVHRKRWRWKEQTLHRRVANVTKSGLFVWYSSGTVTNGKGSLMVYAMRDGAITPWYAGVTERVVGWQLDHVKGIDRSLVSSFIATEPASAMD